VAAILIIGHGIGECAEGYCSRIVCEVLT